MNEELTFEQWLRRGRKARDLTQTELARQVSCALGTIRKLEADELRPSKELATRMANYFGVQQGEHAAFVAYARSQADTPLESAREKAASTAPTTTLASHRHNLPVQPTPFIGRERDVGLVRDRLRQPDVRLLTLTGTGGVGKTRLALQVAAALLDDFRDGVWFVDLATVRDPALVLAKIATVLQLQHIGGHALADSIKAYLRDRNLLLVLDNFEQVVAAAPLVADLLAATPLLNVLVTSRMVVGIYGEHDIAVPPLMLPDPLHLPPFDQLRRYEAVQLFITRAQAASASFALSPANAQVVAELCQRLDGLPLAIELAAARLRHLPRETILARLSSRLQLLMGGARTLPARQQTLRDTLAWSYDLLSEISWALGLRS